MDNLRAVLSVMLSKMPVNDVLSGRIEHDNISKDAFTRLSKPYVKNYTNDELSNLYDYICGEYEKQSSFIMGSRGNTEHDTAGVNVFDAIMIFAVRVLEECNSEPVCRYQHLLRWRMTSHELDEDVFTTAYLAYRDVHGGYTNRNFSWRTIIRHNNNQLNRILDRGMADNHFHLKGSAPQFPLSWLSMMNLVTSSKFRRILERYGKQRLMETYTVSKSEDSLYISYLKAALIRCFLYSRLAGDETAFPRYKSAVRDYDGDEWSEIEICELLRDENEISYHREKLQRYINWFQISGSGERQLDYALNGTYSHNVGVYNETNQILSGERWLLYAMYRLVFSKNQKFYQYFNLFYAYLIIKEQIRSELVQTNDRLGFDNFADYQNRKEDFIEGTRFYRYYIQMAIKGTLLAQSIVSLEARITPADTAKENYDKIRQLDELLDNDKQLQKRYFYVTHFIKERDKEQFLESDIYCRHYKKRKQIYRQAKALAEFREQYHAAARRLRGIDACSNEISCRPEVFSQAYRYLHAHTVYFSDLTWDAEQAMNEDAPSVKIEQLSMTYHVGEDYLDIVDGLRAIDEAIHFLELTYGSRIGHGLVLGVDVDEYYELKKSKILITQQGYLDNIVWLYYKIQEFHITGYEDLVLFIEKEYERLFRIIYRNNFDEAFLADTVRKAQECGDGIRYQGYFYSNDYSFDIATYYGAWKLRGDDPECYINGFFEEKDFDIDQWNQYATNKSFPKDYGTRFVPECAFLYHLYHYNSRAKKEGSKRIEIHPTHQWIQCVKEVQLCMRRKVEKRGIGLEINPSSNYMIGAFRRYADHPALNLCNVGLKSDIDDDNSLQLPICINTDDQGIFSTYLDNEYALIALALEKEKDINGRNKYTREQIYRWVDHVRQCGIDLSFMPRYNRPFREKDDRNWKDDGKEKNYL